MGKLGANRLHFSHPSCTTPTGRQALRRAGSPSRHFHFYILTKAQPVSPSQASRCETAAAASPGNELALCLCCHIGRLKVHFCAYVSIN